MMGHLQLAPIATNPDTYKVVFENERVRALEYHDEPGDKTTPHRHSDAVTVSLTGFDGKPYSGGKEVVSSLAI